jgi:superfamily II DNA helicase RecQ
MQIVNEGDNDALDLLNLSSNSSHRILIDFAALIKQNASDTPAITNMSWKVNRNNRVDFSIVCMNTRDIYLSQFQVVYEDYFNRLTIIFRKLIGRFNYLEELPSIVDDLGETCPGYSFLTDNRNSFIHIESRKFAQYNYSGPTTKTWLKWCDEFMGIVAFLTHFSSGQPARHSELQVSQSLFNTSGNIRNLYWYQDRIMLVQRYSKTDNMLGNNREIMRFLYFDPRFMPKRLSRFVFYYLVYIRPVVFSIKAENTAANRLELAIESNTFYFGNQAINIKRSIVSALSEGFQFKINFGEYRQLCSLILHQHFDVEVNVSDATDNDTDIGNLHSQAGHSTGTARSIYGFATVSRTMETPKAQLDKFFLASLKWHRFHKFETTDEMRVRSTLAPEQLLFTDPFNSAPNIPNLSNLPSTDKPTESIALDPRQSILVLNTLKAVVGPSCNGFRSVEQFESIKAIIDSKNTISVLPTGQGKSTIMMMLPFFETQQTSVVVPLFESLRTELISTFINQNIPHVVYEGSNHFDHISLRGKLLLLSVRQAITVDGRDLLSRLHERNQLTRIIVDEAHEFVYSIHYRQDVSSLRQLLSSLPVPLVLFTATLPPSEAHIVSEFFNRNFHVIRCSTVRPNIKFDIRIEKTHNCGESVCKRAQLSFVKKVLSERVITSSYRMIVYVTNRHMVKEVKSWLQNYNTNVYISGNPDNVEEMRNWFEKGCVMIATTAFGQGINHQGVSDVLILGYTYRLVDISQMSGRAGRDGSPATVYLVTCPRVIESISPTDYPDVESQTSNTQIKKVVKFITSKDCFRKLLHCEIDGTGYRCFELPKTELCSNCELVREGPTTTGNNNQTYSKN